MNRIPKPQTPNPRPSEGDILIAIQQASAYPYTLPNPALSAIANNPTEAVVDAMSKDVANGIDSPLVNEYRRLERARMRSVGPRIARTLAAVASVGIFIGSIGGLKYVHDSGFNREYAPIIPGNSIGLDPNYKILGHPFLPTIAEKDPTTNKPVYRGEMIILMTTLGVWGVGITGAAAVSSNGSSNPQRIRKDAKKLLGKGEEKG